MKKTSFRDSKIASFSTVFSELRLLDYVTFIYFAIISSLALIFHQRLADWYWYIVAHLVSMALLLLLFKYAENTKIRFIKFIRELYPMLLFIVSFKEVSLFIQAIFPLWFEPHLMAWDLWPFGIPTTVWVQQHHRPWLTEIMAFCYVSYYYIMPGGCFVFLLRKNWRMVRSCSLHVALTNYLCYLTYFVLGARGPRNTLAHLHNTREAAGLFDHIVLTIQSTANISGAAFPSSHVAATWVVLIFMFRDRFSTGLLWTPLIIGLILSTVYLQYHYLLDSVAGIVFVSCVTYPLGRWLEKKYSREDFLSHRDPV